MFDAYNGAIYPLDFLAVAVLNRSLSLIEGFSDLVLRRNFISSVPLLRLQLDNCLRFSAAWIVDNPHDFAMKVLAGKHIKNMKDRNGQKMTDKYLVDELSKEKGWIRSVYNHTSGYIHLSEKHIFNAAKFGPEDGKVSMKISSEDINITEEDYLDLIGAFVETTKLLFTFIAGWVSTKTNPDIVKAGSGEGCP